LIKSRTTETTINGTTNETTIMGNRTSAADSFSERKFTDYPINNFTNNDAMNMYTHILKNTDISNTK
jgi:hypothetical protein